MKMIRFNCGSCGQRYKAEDDFAGEEMECNKCGATVSIPHPEDIAPSAEEIISTVKNAHADGTQELKMPKLSLPSSLAKKAENTPPIPTAQNTNADSTPESKMPKISMPASLAQKTQDEEVEESAQEKTGDACPNCGTTLQSATAIICTECGHNVKMGMNANTVKKAKTAGKLGLAIGIGAGAALLSGGIWAGIAIYFKIEIGWIACLVGLITGAAVCMVTQERSERIGALAVALACIGLLTGKMLSAEYLVLDSFKGLPKMFKKMTQFNGRSGKQSQEDAFLSRLKEEMQDNGEISDPYKSEEVKKIAPKIGEKPSEGYKKALKEASKQNMAKVKKKLATLSAEDKARLQKIHSRLGLIFPLWEEMIASGEISKPDKKYKDLAPKNIKEKPSKEYLEAKKKYDIQMAENMKKIRVKLAKISDAEAKRLEGEIASSFANRYSYWEKLEMLMSLWDILWFIVAFSIAGKLGTGTSIFSKQGI